MLQQIVQLQQQLAQLQSQPVQWCHDFKMNLKIGDSGEEVSALQTALGKEGFPVMDIEENGPGNNYFGEITASAVTAFQEKYKSEILTPFGLRHGTGYVGPATRAKLNKLYGCPSSTQPSITVLSPNGGEKWEIGSRQIIRWASSNLRGKQVAIELIYTANTEGAPYEIALTDNTGSFVWTVGNIDDGMRRVRGGNYKIRIREIIPIVDISGASDDSDAPFSIVAATTTPSITVLSPNGGEVWQIGSTQPITWTGSYGKTYTIHVYDQNGYTRGLIANVNGVSSDKQVYYWNVGQVIVGGVQQTLSPGKYKILIIEEGGKTSDESDAPFTIVAAGFGLTDVQKMLASISQAVSQLAEQIKWLLGK